MLTTSVFLPSPIIACLIIVSGGSSITTTIRYPVPRRPSLSVAVHLTVVSPTGNLSLECGLQITVLFLLPSLSNAVGIGYFTFAPFSSVASTSNVVGKDGNVGKLGVVVIITNIPILKIIHPNPAIMYIVPILSPGCT